MQHCRVNALHTSPAMLYQHSVCPGEARLCMIGGLLMSRADSCLSSAEKRKVPMNMQQQAKPGAAHAYLCRLGTTWMMAWA